MHGKHRVRASAAKQKTSLSVYNLLMENSNSI
jgi:hypothetical protein